MSSEITVNQVPPRRVYIETYGCQMNVADSELMAGILAERGFSKATAAEDADVILLNTCAIRDKAEDRIFGRLGWLKPLKDARPELVLGVAGCMAEHLRDALVKRAPHVDLVIGPDAYRRLPALLDELSTDTSHDPMIDVRLDRREVYDGINPVRATGVNGFVTIMRGCDKFCTYCIVPLVRGRERSVPADEIVRQTAELAAQGYREVTLLGQTVTSYRMDGVSFAQLLRRLHDETDIARIRYTSPWPKDFDDELIGTLNELPRIGRHIHLPMQSGSSKVLADMKRGYAAEEYVTLVERIRHELPDFAISTDVIVGFPGETEDDFQQTLQIVKMAQFDNAFMFKYSERSGTYSAKHIPDDVPEAVKGERLMRLIALQEENCRTQNATMVGKLVDVLVEGPNRRDPTASMGRTSCFRTTVLAGTHRPGTIVRAHIDASSTHTLFAQAAATA